MKKYLFIFIITAFCIIFSLFIYNKKQIHTVLNIINPTTIQIDLNNNGRADYDETICIADSESFSLDLKFVKPKFLKDINLSDREILSLAYLADEYANNLLKFKQVRVKLNNKTNDKCKSGDILINNNIYSKLLLDSGFAANKGTYNKEKFDNNLKEAKKLDLVVLNNKNNKYHDIHCKYASLIEHYTILPKSKLKSANKPCRFCNVPKETKSKNTNLFTKTITANGNIKFILTDFTNKLKPDTNCTNNACIELLSLINSSKNSINIAAYGWDNIPKLNNALIKAKERGVKIKLVYDRTNDIDKYYYKGTPTLIKLADISVSDYVKDKPSFTKFLMHNKFMIFDDNIVYTGSVNFSTTGLSGFNGNSIVIINSKEIANLYNTEFNQMLNGNFHQLKTKSDLPNSFTIGNSKIAVYFSPQDNSIQYIIDLINNAKSYIYMPIFVITHDKLTEALINAKKRGVDIKIIVDATSTSTRNTKYKQLRLNNIPLKVENYAGKLHSKSIIIDDKYLVVGSMNFSASGNNKNDENLLIIQNEAFTKTYKDFFIYLWNKIPDKWLKYNPAPEGKDSIGSCNDGIDNNYDGKTDFEDIHCQ